MLKNHQEMLIIMPPIMSVYGCIRPFPMGGSRVFGKGGKLEAAISGMEMYSQHAKHAGIRGSGGMPSSPGKF